MLDFIQKRWKAIVAAVVAGCMTAITGLADGGFSSTDGLLVVIAVVTGGTGVNYVRNKM